MFDKPKKESTVALVLSKLMASKGKPMSSTKDEPKAIEVDSEPKDEGDEGDDSDKEAEYEAAAEEVLAALESKDARALAESLRAFCCLCDSEHDEIGSDSEGE